MKIYPTGQPTIIRENFEPISNYFSLIKCKVLAPANLYHPVFPARAKGKLFFPDYTYGEGCGKKVCVCVVLWAQDAFERTLRMEKRVVLSGL